MVITFSFLFKNHFSLKAAAKVKQFNCFLTTRVKKIVPFEEDDPERFPKSLFVRWGIVRNV